MCYRLRDVLSTIYFLLMCRIPGDIQAFGAARGVYSRLRLDNRFSTDNMTRSDSPLLR